jgi:hypothetical protein
MNKNHKHVVLFLSDKSTLYIVEQYEKLVSAQNKNTDVFYLYHNKTENLPENLPEKNLFVFTDAVLHELGYIPVKNSLLPGSSHFPLLQFFRKNPQFAYYWLIEDDVAFSGDWSVLFDAFSKNRADFISTTIRKYEEEPYWSWWWSLRSPEKLTRYDCVRSFNPICRLSNAALHCLDNALQNEWAGHHEVTIPTIMQYNGMKIIDMGAAGSFTPRTFKNLFYTLETMWWQSIRAVERKNCLYHPIKEPKN